MRIAVSGATGFIGNYLVKALTEKGHDLRLLIREGRQDAVPATTGGSVEFHVGDRTSSNHSDSDGRYFRIMSRSQGASRSRDSECFFCASFNPANTFNFASPAAAVASAEYNTDIRYSA